MSAQEYRWRSPEWASIGPWVVLGVLSSAIVLTTIGLALQIGVGVYMTPFAYELAQSGAILADSIVGLVIIRRLPGHPIAWILLASGLNWGLRQALFGYAAQGLATPHGGVAPAIAALVYWADTPTDLVVITWFCVLFPDGRLVSAGWGSLRWTALFSALYLFVATLLKPGPLHGFEWIDNPIGSEALGGALNALSLPPSALLLLSFFGGAISLLARLGRSAGTERQQIKWVAWAGCLYVISFGIFLFTPESFSAVAFGGVALATVGAAVAIYFAILRRRLYDIDLLINRTVVYGATSAAIALTFFSGIVALQPILRPFTSGSELATAASTLVSFALFQPVRRRLQSAVDRRFDRSRYDAARTLDAFTVRLRDEVDLDAVRADLISVIYKTVRPAHASVWLRSNRQSGAPRVDP
jgi:hypothetical protein